MSDASIECWRPGARRGIMLRVERVEGIGDLVSLLEAAGEVAASLKPELRRVGDPGFWVACCAASALMDRRPAMVMRGTARESSLHARVVCEGSPMLCEWPTWPVAELGARRIDLRPADVLAAGPSDADLLAAAQREGIDTPGAVIGLRGMFDIGALAWSKRPGASGRWEVVSVIDNPKC